MMKDAPLAGLNHAATLRVRRAGKFCIVFHQPEIMPIPTHLFYRPQ